MAIASQQPVQILYCETTDCLDFVPLQSPHLTEKMSYGSRQDMKVRPMDVISRYRQNRTRVSVCLNEEENINTRYLIIGNSFDIMVQFSGSRVTSWDLTRR